MSSSDEQAESAVSKTRKTRKLRQWTVKKIKHRIKTDPQVIFRRDEEGRTLLMLHIRNENVVKELLKLGADFSAQTNTGKSVLMFAAEYANICCNSLQLLMDYGADSSVCDDFNQNVLFYVVKRPESFTAENFRILIRGGANPLTENKDHINILAYATNRFFEIVDVRHGNKTNKYFQNGRAENNFPSIIKALHYLYELPQFVNKSFRFNENFPIDMHPQNVLLKNWHTHISQLPIFEFLFTKTHLIDPQMTVSRPLISLLFNNHPTLRDRWQLFNFSPIGLLLNFDIWPLNLDKWKCVIEKLFTYGFTLSHPNCISPLTLILLEVSEDKMYDRVETNLEYITHDNDWMKHQGKEIRNEIFCFSKFLIENGDNIGQKSFVYRFEHFQEVASQIFLPDAIFVALWRPHVLCLRLMLPHLAAPPLSLLLVQYNGVNAVTGLFPMLAEWGPLPPGTDLMRRLRNYFDELRQRNNLSDVVYNMFLNMHSSPPSLKHLSRCAIRMSLAERASQADESLPSLLEKISPHFLLDYLKMVPSEPINLAFCRDPKLAKIAKKHLYLYVFYSNLDSDSDAQEEDEEEDEEEEQE